MLRRILCRSRVTASALLVSWLAGCTWLAGTAAGAHTPIRRLTVTLRGQPYEIEDVTTVGELRAQLAEQVGELSSSQPQRIKLLLAGGQRLPDDPMAVLADVGVPTTGAQLSALPSSSSGKKKKSATTTNNNNNKPIASASTAGPAAASNPMKDYLQQAGIDTAQLDEMMKSFGGAGEQEQAPSLQDSMTAMKDVMNSPMLQEMMNDPERLEQSRQMILSNPMLKSMMGGMPGMEELLSDKDAWREAMQAAAEIYKNMDSDQLMKTMMAGMGAAGMPPMGGMGGGAGANLFDGTLDDSMAATAALDELDEDE